MADGTKSEDFGSCCSSLKEALESEDFDPLITVGDDGILYMTVGLVDIDEDGPGLVDHPVFHCPFCGERLQTAEEVRRKSEAAEAAEAAEEGSSN